MTIDKHEAAALSRLFSASVLQDLGKKARSPLFTRLLTQTRFSATETRASTVGETFDEAFQLLRNSKFRDDYVYRTALTQKILLGRHSLKTATLLNELRAGSSKADVVVLNGTATAYEIKSERDSTSRLQGQLENYRQTFASVNVVVSESHLDTVLRNTPEDVGVITLSKRFRLQTVRAPQNRPERILPAVVLETLRAGEAVELLRNLGQDFPKFPNTQIRNELGKVFSTLDPVAVHGEMVNILKTRRSQADLSNFIRSIPSSLQAVSLAAKTNPHSRARIKEAVDTPLAEALSWK